VRPLLGALIALGFLAACAIREPFFTPPVTGDGSTFSRFHESAVAGDSESQNLVGFMQFFGEGAARNRGAALNWFSEAAASGHMSAQLNLAMIYSLGVGVPRNPVLADRFFVMARDNAAKPPVVSRLIFSTLPELIDQSCDVGRTSPRRGQETYLTYCAGCHGFNGVAAFAGSPSFGLGERMEKSDAELMGSILGGHDIMPRWGDKLPRNDLDAVLGYVRSLQLGFRGGILHSLNTPPPRYYLFGPMTFDFSNQPVDTVYYTEESDPSDDLCSQQAH